jgi:hypothetical protein
VPEPELETGTAMDEFLPIYRQLSRPTKDRRGFAPHEVDAMDLTVIAMLLGHGADPMRDQLAEQADLARRLAAGEDVNWDDVPA